MHQLEYRRIPPLPAQTPGIPEGPRRRYLSSVVLAVFVRVTIRFGGGRGGEGRRRGTPSQDTEFVSVALSYCLLRLFTHLTRIFSLNFPPLFHLPSPPPPPPPPRPVNTLLLPFRCNRTRLRMSKLTSHPPSNGCGQRKCVSARVENLDYIFR